MKWPHLALAFALTICHGCPNPTPPHQMIVVTLDTLRADHLGLYGYSRPTSPELDALARESVVFEDAISQSSSTSPSHRSLFKSRIASRASDDTPELAEILAGHGYATAAFTGGGMLSTKIGFGRGFETYEEETRGFDASLPRIQSWLQSHADEPFFLFLHTYDIHLPYDSPPPFDNMFFPDYEGPVRGEVTRDLFLQIRGIKPYDAMTERRELNEYDRRKMIALYDGGIRHTDQNLGRLIGFLRELGIWRELTFVVLSDHGEEFWDHGSVSHGHTLYQELLHVPLLLHLPGAKWAGERVKSVVRLMDVAPTLLELAGVDAPASFQGSSLLSLLDDEPQPVEPAIAEMLEWKSRIEPPWKLIVQITPGGDDLEISALFHLQRDPLEQHNLASELPALAQLQHEALKKELSSDQTVSVRVIKPDIVDEELLEQLRELGYIEDEP